MSESRLEWSMAENARLENQVEKLIRDLHRIDCARQAAVSQCLVMAERISELESALGGQAVGERGAACMSIDGGNL